MNSCLAFAESHLRIATIQQGPDSLWIAVANVAAKLEPMPAQNPRIAIRKLAMIA